MQDNIFVNVGSRTDTPSTKVTDFYSFSTYRKVSTSARQSYRSQRPADISKITDIIWGALVKAWPNIVKDIHRKSIPTPGMDVGKSYFPLHWLLVVQPEDATLPETSVSANKFTHGDPGSYWPTLMCRAGYSNHSSDDLLAG